MKTIIRLFLKPFSYTFLHIYTSILFDNFRKQYRHTKQVSTKKDLFQWIVSTGSSFHYLEFGVFQGSSLKLMTELNKSPDSNFYGFDTFKGLPENWIQGKFGNIKIKKNGFDVKGNIPQLDDKRVVFVKGLFQDTCDDFIKRHHDTLLQKKLVINIDADLYSSALYILTKIAPYLKNGDYIYFDEFFSHANEFLAYKNFVNSYYIQLEPILQITNFSQVLFQVKKD